MAIELIAKIAPKNDGFTGMVDADQVIGGSNLPNTVGHTEWDAAYTHISSDGTDHTYINQDLRIAASPTFANVYVPDEGYIGATGGTVGWTFDTAGDISTTAKVNIGGTSPQALLHVGGSTVPGFGNAVIIAERATVPDIVILETTNTIKGRFSANNTWPIAGGNVVIGSQTSHPFHIVTNNTVKVTVLPGGNAGIGETAPDSLLHLTKATTPAIRLEHTTTTSYSGIYFYQSTTVKAGIQLIGSTFATTARQNDLEIYSVTGDLVLQRTGGNVGIGTTGPVTLLNVGSGTGVAAWFNGATEEGILIDPQVSYARLAIVGDVAAELLLYDDNATANQGLFRIIAAENLTKFQAVNDTFTLVPYEFMTFDHSNGRVGIGTTGPLAKCHITNTAVIPVLALDQADISEGFINFIGSDRGSISDLYNPIHSVRVELNGVVWRVGLYFDA